MKDSKSVEHVRSGSPVLSKVSPIVGLSLFIFRTGKYRTSVKKSKSGRRKIQSKTFASISLKMRLVSAEELIVTQEAKESSGSFSEICEWCPIPPLNQPKRYVYADQGEVENYGNKINGSSATRSSCYVWGNASRRKMYCWWGRCRSFGGDFELP